MSVRGAHPLVATGALVALAAAIAMQIARDNWYPPSDRETARLLYVRSGEALKRIALEYDALAADVYWIRALQHYGGDRLARDRTGPRYELLYPLLDLTTTLDPYFKIAYRFGAIFLSEVFPGGAGRPDQAIVLLRKGIGAQPHMWQYYHDIAFVYYWNLHDYHAASDWFGRASEQPGAPNWLAPLAANMLSKGQDRTAARFLWEQILKADQPWLRRTAERALVQLEALDHIDQLSAIVRRVPLAPGEYSWHALARAGAIRGIPQDPTGTPYEIDPRTGKVSVSPQSPLFPMPDQERIPAR